MSNRYYYYNSERYDRNYSKRYYDRKKKLVRKTVEISKKFKNN